MHTAHRQWLDEHDALAAVLHSLAQLAQRLVEAPDEVDFCASRAMLVYLGDYPERIHHAFEDRELFARLRGRDAALDATLNRLRSQHHHGADTVRALEHKLNCAEFAGAAARQQYAQEVERFVSAYLGHLQVEEREIFVAAERLLTEEEWQALAAVLDEERDPLHGIARDAAFEQLLGQISQVAAPQAGAAGN